LGILLSEFFSLISRIDQCSPFQTSALRTAASRPDVVSLVNHYLSRLSLWLIVNLQLTSGPALIVTSITKYFLITLLTCSRLTHASEFIPTCMVPGLGVRLKNRRRARDADPSSGVDEVTNVILALRAARVEHASDGVVWTTSMALLDVRGIYELEAHHETPL
jgi:hypothetical protein